jgi:putative membrane protein
MVPEIIAGVLLGVGLGMFSGLVPGIHANTMAAALLVVQAPLLVFLGPDAVAASLFAALVTHTFLDIIPSTFVGIPDPDTALSVLPAHALCLEGRGEEAVRLSALGSAGAVIVSLPLAAFFFYLLPSIQPAVDWGIALLLIAVAGALIVNSDSPPWSGAVFLCSGLLGLFTLSTGMLAWHILGDEALLLPLLSGLFGIPVLLAAHGGTMPFQQFSGFATPAGIIRRNVLTGTIAGAVVGWLPGLSTATANALLSGGARYEQEREGYIIATSAANTANAMLGLAALYALSRTRNGVMAALSELTIPSPLSLLFAGTAAAVISYLLCICFAGRATALAGISIRPLSVAVTLFIIAATLFLTGPFGLLVLLLATAVGWVPQLVNIRRVSCMGAIMVPVILISLGLFS